MTSVFRIVFLLVFSLFWGGLTFYTGLVVRVTHDVLNDPMDGGLITQRVTDALQILGLVTLVLMGANGAIVMRKSKRFGITLFGLFALIGVSLVGLFVVHGQMDAVIEIQSSMISDREAFTAGHRRYNQLTTVEWLSSLAYLVITVFAWRSIDDGLHC